MIRTTQLTIMPEGGNIFDEGAYILTLEDEAGGEFLVVAENQPDGTGKIRIDRIQWPELRDAVERLLKEIGE